MFDPQLRTHRRTWSNPWPPNGAAGSPASSGSLVRGDRAAAPARSAAGSLAIALLILGVAPAASAQHRLTRVSVDSAGGQGNEASGDSGLSGDGRFVAFQSAADNLVAGDGNGLADIFVHDRQSGATVRVSVDATGAEANGESRGPSLSADGRFVAFESEATNLVAGDLNDAWDVFVFDRDPDANGLFDEGNGYPIRVSVDSGGVEGNDWSYFASICGDGTAVAFTSDSDNLVAGDTNSVADAFVHELATGTTTRISVSSSGGEGDLDSGGHQLSHDGRFVTFSSRATNLVPVDTNGIRDVFLHDRSTGTTEMVSLDSNGNQYRGYGCYGGSPSDDGSLVAFGVTLDLGGAAYPEVHLRDLGAGTTRLVNSGSGISLSGDGQRALYQLTTYDPNWPHLPDEIFVFAFDLQQDTHTLLSQTCWGDPGNGFSFAGSISRDGEVAVFSSDASDLVAGDTNSSSDVLACDLTLSEPPASWIPYGTGYPGTLGVPGLTLSALPRFGASLEVQADNSRGASTFGLLLAGLDRAQILTSAGGTILVDAALLLPRSIPSAGLTIPFSIPLDPAWCGLVLDLQLIQVDPGATHGLSFTPGLEMVVGQ